MESTCRPIRIDHIDSDREKPRITIALEKYGDKLDANKVGRWRTRVAKEGMSSIEKERPRGANHGGKDSKSQAELRSQVLEATTQTTPSDATHWSCRSMARHLNTTPEVSPRNSV